MKELEIIKNIIREQLEELYSGDIESIAQHEGKVVESVIVGDYELALINIWDGYRVALTHSDLSFFTPQSQTIKRDVEKHPRMKFPLKVFLDTLTKWCDKYEKISVGSFNPRNMAIYRKVIENSNLFDIISQHQYEVFIKNKKK
jgi:hypothetical protein